MAVAAAKAGKHIFCEKPCAVTYDQTREMAEAADKAGVVNYLNHNYRRVPAVAFAKQMIEEGKLGTIPITGEVYICRIGSWTRISR